jgi:hypothetical protein
MLSNVANSGVPSRPMIPGAETHWLVASERPCGVLQTNAVKSLATVTPSTSNLAEHDLNISQPEG